MPLSLLRRLLRSKDSRYVTAIVVLSTGLAIAVWRVDELEKALAAKPKIITETEVETKIVTVEGPERIVEKIVEKPGGERIIERVIEKEATRTETGTEAKAVRSQTPTGKLDLPRRYIGLAIDPISRFDKPRFRAGLTVWNRLDLGVAYDTRFPLNRGGAQIEAALRF